MLFFEFSNTREVLFAENKYDLEGTCKLKLYSDLSYHFIANKSLCKERIPGHSGTYLVKNDTIFFIGKLNSVFGTTAIIKNGFIEFLDGPEPFKFEIFSQDLVKMDMSEKSRRNDYTIFSYAPTFYKHIFPVAKPYDLTNEDIRNLDRILVSCLRKYAVNKKISSYQKQYVAVLNKHNEKEVWVNCGCKNAYQLNSFKYSLINVLDGGDCYFRVTINLSKHNYSHFSVNGEA